MGVFDSIFRRRRETAPASQPEQAPATQTAPESWRYDSLVDLFRGGGDLNVAAAYRCINFLANKVASLPLHFERLRDGVFETDVNSRLHYLLTVQPSENMSAFDFWWLAEVYVQTKGNAYIIPVWNAVTMDWARLALVNPDCVAHDTINDTYTVHDIMAGISGTYRESEVIHLKNYTKDGKNGLSTLSFARVALDTASAGDAETLGRFKNGGNVRGIVSNDTSVRGFGEYQDKELEKTATNLDDRFRSGQRIVSVPGQVQFNPLSLSSTDMQFLETRKFTVLDICRFFGVHPSFVFEDTTSNYKSAELANAAFLSDTLNPMLRKIECELLRKLVSPSLAIKRRFIFDRTELYACDLNSRMKYLAAAVAAGVYTVNEVRRMENRPVVEGGDTVLVSANLRNILDPETAGSGKNNENDED